MTTPTPTQPTVPPAAKPPVRQRLSELVAFAAAPESRPARLGMLGAALITVGGLGAGSTKPHDPLLESLHLSWLRFGHGLVLSSIVLWSGVGLMLIAWLALGRHALAGKTTEHTMRVTTGF
ncbi:MAG TPA: alpha-(1-_6)-mannopyranosyltransferase A, partial [Mycobacterium sp.]|nr:alpha-(1->6)-mannopyranosyltransferase A [Mycobacterium sp.]